MADPLAHLIRSHPAGSVLSVLVVPGASRSEIVGIHGDALRVRVAAPPEQGKANKATLATVARALGCRADLLSGATSRRKRILLRDVPPEAAVLKIASILA